MCKNLGLLRFHLHKFFDDQTFAFFGSGDSRARLRACLRARQILIGATKETNYCYVMPNKFFYSELSLFFYGRVRIFVRKTDSPSIEDPRGPSAGFYGIMDPRGLDNFWPVKC